MKCNPKISTEAPLNLFFILLIYNNLTTSVTATQFNLVYVD